MANIFLDAGDTFTQSSTNTGDTIFGSTGSETVVLQGNPDGTLLDGNVEEVQVAGNAADTTLQVNAQGQLELTSGGTVYATFTAGLNAAVDLKFEDGNVTLTQTGANSFTVEDPADDTDSATIDTNTSQTGGAVTLGTDDSTAGSGGSGGTGQTFTLTESANTVAEGDTVTYTVTADSAVTADTTLTVSVSGSDLNGAATAASATDYTLSDASVTFANGAAAGSTQTFTVTANTDDVTEGFEGFQVSLLDDSFATVASETTGITNVDTLERNFTLTTGVDQGSAFTGGAGDDTFTGILQGANGTGTTIQAGDALSGAGGTDTLNIAVSGDAGAAFTLSAVTTTDIEEVLLTNFEVDGGITTVDASTMAGLTTVGLTASGATGDTTFSNVQNIVTAQMGNGTADLTVNYAAAAVAGTADTQALTLTGGQTDGDFIADAGIETVAITTSGSESTLNALTATGATETTIAAASDFTITTALAAGITTVDASASTGDLTLSLTNAADHTATLGSGDDTLNMAATIAAADTIEGGGGTDTIAITGAATAAEAANVTGFEVLDVTGDFTQDASVVAGITSLVANAAGAADDTVAFTNASATQTLNVRSVDSADDDVSLALATDTPSDTATVTLGTATAGVTFDDLTLNDAETINIANNGGTSAIAELISGDATSVVATGSEQLTMTAFTAANIATVDASAMTGDFIMGAAASNQDSTITGGSGDNTLIGGTGDDNITGGSGENTITAGTGDDTVTGGASDDTINEVEGDDSIDAAGGDDTIIISTFTDLTSDDVINGGDGDDTIDFQEDANHDFTNDTTIVSGISNIETLQFSDLTGADDTVTINDAVISNQAITLAATGNTTGATFDASGVLSSTTTVTFNDTSANDNTYSVGNAVDVVNMGAGNDTVTVGTTAFLGGSDAINGGAGTDTITFTNTADATISAAQLGAIENVETVAINTGGGGNYTLALTDTIVGAQVSAGETFTVSRTDADTGTTSVDGSAVTDTFNLSLDGGAGADTLTGGAGDDTLDGNEGVDVLDLSAGGTDTVTIESEAAANGVTLTGFTTRGTGTTADAEADVLQIDESEINGGGFAPAGTGVGTLVAADFAEVDLAAGGTLTLQDNHVNVIAGKGFNDLDGVIADGSITAGGNGEEAFILFYNLSTQRAEMFYDTDISDGNTGAELVASFTDIDLTGMAGFDSTNFEIA